MSLQAASYLVTVPEFMAQYFRNSKTLSRAYEKEVMQNAISFVSQRVGEVTRQRVHNNLEAR